MKKSVKKYQPGGLVDSEGNPVRDGSGNPIMTGSSPDEDEITARGRAKNAEMLKSFFNRATGRGKETPAAASAGPAAGTSSLRDPQQMAASKASVGMDESDLRREAAANAPKRMPTRPGQSAPKAGAPKTKSGMVTKEQLAKSGMSLREYMNQQQGKTARDSSAPAKTASKAVAKTQPANMAKSDFEAAQRKRSDMIVALTKAEREAPAGTSSLAKQKIAESKRKVLDEYATAGKAEERKNYVPRATPGARAPKQTTSKAKPYMPEKPDMSFRKGGSVSSASKRADGIAQRGKTRGKVY